MRQPLDINNLRHRLHFVWQWLTQPARPSIEAAPIADVIIACLHKNSDQVAQLAATAHQAQKGKFVFASGAYAETIREKIMSPGYLFTDTLGDEPFSTLRNARQQIEEELPPNEFNSATIVCPVENAQRFLGLWDTLYGGAPQLAICPPPLPLNQIYKNSELVEPTCRLAVAEIRAIQGHIRRKEIAGQIPNVVLADFLELELLLS